MPYFLFFRVKCKNASRVLLKSIYKKKKKKREREKALLLFKNSTQKKKILNRVLKNDGHGITHIAIARKF